MTRFQVHILSAAFRWRVFIELGMLLQQSRESARVGPAEP